MGAKLGQCKEGKVKSTLKEMSLKGMRQEGQIWPGEDWYVEQTKSAHVLRLGCYTIPEQSRLGVTIQRARIDWEQREADNARGRMGGREASMGRGGTQAPGSRQAGTGGLDNAAVMLSACQSGAVRGKQIRE